MLQKLCLYCFHLKYIKKQFKKKKKIPFWFMSVLQSVLNT